MKFIFDFDDVLFHTSKRFKTHVIPILGKHGITSEQVVGYFKKEQWNKFSMRKMLASFSLHENLYEEVMNQNKNFVNEEVIEIIKEIHKKNCYIITYGDEEFQLDKITRAGIAPLFSEIIV